MPLILASSSSIRKQMLDAAGVAHQAIAPGLDESRLKREIAGPEVAEALAKAKAVDVSKTHPSRWVIGSDSVLCVAGQRYSKPASRDEAAEHLRGFSGQTMELTSAVALAQDGQVDWSHSQKARLHVRALSEDFIQSYLDLEWPEVSYCVGVFRLEGPGVQLFERIDGDYFTILGMPLLPLLGALRERGAAGLMIRLALTGSIGMGKSTVARMFAAAGIPVFDADAEVRALQAEDGALVGAIGQRFPAAVRNGRLDREQLAHIVLEDTDELKALEAIVHPAVRAARERFIADHAGVPALLFDIPLLFETGGEDDFDKVVVVSAPEAVQRRRVLARPGMTGEKFESIRARQMPDAEKRRRADFIIETGGDLSTTETQVGAILTCLGLAPSR